MPDQPDNCIARFESTYKELKSRSPKSILVTIFCFESTYKELKYTIPDIRTDNNIKVLSLPIRNWNHVCSRVFQIPDLVLSLPIRNWNKIRPGRTSGEVSVLSLPIRNWNPTIWRGRHIHRRSFESTYKELKQVIVGKQRNGPTGFESTYKELKLKIIIQYEIY